jgi:L,D-transpeptidase YcbB
MSPDGCRLSRTIAMLLVAGLCGLLLLPRAAAIGPDDRASASIPPAQPVPADTPSLVDAEIKGRLDVAGTVSVAGERAHSELMRRFYAAHDYATVWDTRHTQAEVLLNAVLRAGDHGLDPDAFHAGLLTRPTAILSPIERDLLLSDAFLGYADALARGAVPIEDRTGDEDLTPETIDIPAALDAALSHPDPAKVIEMLAPQTPEYAALQRIYASYRPLAAAVMPPRKSGRQLHEEVAARRLRQVAVALERLRWLPRVLPADRVWVDTADARLELFRDNRLVFATRVVIGEDNWQTPEVIANSTSILFNPPWLVPRSIAVKEILPRLAWDPDYLARHHMTRRGGGTFRQEPGPHSALGRLKFEMPNRFDVFLHDTPMKELFASVDRRHSHGCVRIENPRMLAAMLLQKGPEAIDRAIAVGYTHRQSLPTPVPIFLVYQTVVVEPDGSVQFRPDFYGRDEKIWQHLTRPVHRPVAHGGASNRNG